MESENRIREREDNDKMTAEYGLILGAFCALLAIIGIAHVFSHTLGFMRQRKREFARYMSVGLIPEGIRKMFCIEALMIVGRPALIALAYCLGGKKMLKVSLANALRDDTMM